MEGNCTKSQQMSKSVLKYWDLKGGIIPISLKLLGPPSENIQDWFM